MKPGLVALDALLFNNSIFTQVGDLDFEFYHDVSSDRLGRSRVLDGQDDKPELQIHALAHDTADEMIGTILHEMGHIVVGLAYKSEGMLDENCGEELEQSHEYWNGETGHGWNWQLLAAHLEKGVEKILGRKVNLGRLNAALNESYETGITDLRYFELLYSIRAMEQETTPEGARFYVVGVHEVNMDGEGYDNGYDGDDETDGKKQRRRNR